MKMSPEVVPLLVVRGAARAIDFYVGALGARVFARYEHGAERHVSHADLTLGDRRFAVTEEAHAWNSFAPPSLGGSPVVLQLSVADAEATFASLCDAGATVIFPVQELLGERMARVQDPFGHIWLLRQRLEELSIEEIQRRRDELFARAAASAGDRTRTNLESDRTLDDLSRSRQAPNAGRVHLVVGPVGAGKSTFALALARERRAVRLTLDEWMTTLYRPDRPDTGVLDWYVERAERCIEQIWTIASTLVELETDVILEIGLLQRTERERFYQRVHAVGYALTVYVVDAARDVRRERVAERNRCQGATFSMIVPPEIFELASDLWEPPDVDERVGRDLQFVRTDGS